MRARAFHLIAGLTLSLAGFSACADMNSLATAPRSVGSDAQLVGGLVEPTVASAGNALVAPLDRTTPLVEPISWSFIVGPDGATSTNAASGLTIAVPRGALSSTVTITVTALAGSAVAYRFEPHGLTFSRNVTLTQNLAGTSAGVLSGLVLQGAHFPGDEPVITDGLALVTETVNAHINPLSNTVSFPIRHFSGWIVATGRSSSEEDAGQ